MKVIVFLDDRNGMLFNKRRQSRDQTVIEKISRICQNKVLWMKEYSFTLYGNLEGVKVRCDQDFLKKAADEEYVLVETENLESVSDQIQELIVFRWNRVYPADVFLDIDLSCWNKIEESEFPGNSHEKITLQKYILR